MEINALASDYYWNQSVQYGVNRVSEAEPVVKVGKYEVRINDVDPQNATRMEMFALLSYMDDQGLTDNHGTRNVVGSLYLIMQKRHS
ncbi:hypothetical protein [Butyrivibrio sp. WCD2001]|uniref:hypothetical protein n=1 Tax=Butyrivibrio sp. WCD2001 TaxID=1280681 RepID=UPI00047A2928|nr:hypothetical protein [Butyrivibrio sp. WCD2001]